MNAIASYLRDFDFVAIQRNGANRVDVELQSSLGDYLEIANVPLRALQSFEAFQRHVAAKGGVWVGHKSQRGESDYARRCAWFHCVADSFN